MVTKFLQLIHGLAVDIVHLIIALFIIREFKIQKCEWSPTRIADLGNWTKSLENNVQGNVFKPRTSVGDFFQLWEKIRGMVVCN